MREKACSWAQRWTPSEQKSDYGEFKHSAGGCLRMGRVRACIGNLQFPRRTYANDETDGKTMLKNAVYMFDFMVYVHMTSTGLPKDAKKVWSSLDPKTALLAGKGSGNCENWCSETRDSVFWLKTWEPCSRPVGIEKYG
eukprot:gene1552-biopygen274